MLLSLVGIAALALLSIYCGSHLSVTNANNFLNGSSEEMLQLTSDQAYVMPIVSSVFLLMLFFFFTYVQYVLTFLIICLAGMTLYINLHHLLDYIAFIPQKIKLAVSYLFPFICILEWLRSGNFLAHDIIGCSTCITLIATLQFPSLKIASICLVGLLLYDIFWVFLSQYIFNKNVMLEVATKDTVNPIQSTGEYFHIPYFENFQITLSLPIKLIFPVEGDKSFIMLGLGDIALPGMLIAYALRCDKDFEAEQLKTDLEAPTSSSGIVQTKLFEHCLLSYLVGLAMAFYCSFHWNHAQPALLYLVPAVLIPIFWISSRHGRLASVWNGAKLTRS